MLPKIRNGMGQCLAALEHVQCQQLYKTLLRWRASSESFTRLSR